MIILSLIPLAGISAFSYFIGSKQITEDRTKLSLEKMAQDAADKIDLTLLEDKEEIRSMATSFPLIYPRVDQRDRDSIIRLLNNYCLTHEIYDVLAVLDTTGRVIAINTIDRFENRLAPKKVDQILNHSIAAYPEENELFRHSLAGRSAQHDWYRSQLAKSLYDREREDISYQFNVVLSEPIRNPETGEIIGVWINIISWYYFQKILDTVETDLQNLNLRTGYAFMFRKDANTIIAHKYRKNRQYDPEGLHPESSENLYESRLIETHFLRDLHDAIQRKQQSVSYEFPKGNQKISGIAPIYDTSFGWVVGVGIDEVDIFRPVQKMKWWLVGVTVFLASGVVVFTFLIARGITVPLKNLIQTAQTIAQGKLDQRVQIRSSDEVGILGTTFNDMARALSAREDELQELNKNLENIVRLRTLELEDSNEALKKAYLDLQNAQEQLVQSEKMASLGQLVAGIAHEIKNPLNFIYGNTGFLADYTQRLRSILEAYERLPSITSDERKQIETLKKELNYAFIKEDLQTLIDNFSEGARRINAIVSDLRTFSRMDTDVLSDIDLHSSLDMSLNLLRNQYKGRVEIHRDYGGIPKIQGYSGKLSQVFMNLLSNAFHAIQEKGDVWIRTRALNGTVEVEIEDNGMGIPKENLHRIFEPFFTTKAVGQGTGLGLCISYGIIEQHQGKIHVTSTPRQGTVFTVRLPTIQERTEQ
jgi:signal transduction histidine kinase